jgi:hypothetical protein
VSAIAVAASRRARAASDKLTRAILTAASRGLRPHCSDAGTSEMWISEIDSERAQAALLCGGCPVFAECGDAAIAHDERFGVWAGRDFTRKQKKQQAA